MQFRVEVDGLPAGLGVYRLQTPHTPYHRFRVYADRESRMLTIDSLDSGDRWRFARDGATRSMVNTVTDLGEEARWAADLVVSAVFDEFADCPSQAIRDPKDFGWEGPSPRKAEWKKVDCAWFPKERMPTLFLQYLQYPPEPPQIVRVRLWFDGEQIEIFPQRIVYDEPLPESASSPVLREPDTYYIAPLRPGAGAPERLEWEREKNNKRITD